MKIKNRNEKELDLVEQFKRNERQAPWLASQDEYNPERFEPPEKIGPIFPNECSSEPIENDFDSKEIERRMRREAKLLKRRSLHLVLFPVRYCTACGTQITRTYETPSVWGKIRRCAECIKHSRQSTRDRKFCSSCGQDFASELAQACDWRTKAVCHACADLNKKKSEVIGSLL